MGKATSKAKNPISTNELARNIQKEQSLNKLVAQLPETFPFLREGVFPLAETFHNPRSNSPEEPKAITAIIKFFMSQQKQVNGISRKTPEAGDRVFYLLSTDPLYYTDKRLDPMVRVKGDPDPFAYRPENRNRKSKAGRIIDPLTMAPRSPAKATPRLELILFPDPGDWWCRKMGFYDAKKAQSTRRPPFRPDGNKRYRELKARQEDTTTDSTLTKNQQRWKDARKERVAALVEHVRRHPGAKTVDLMEFLRTLGVSNRNQAVAIIQMAVTLGDVLREKVSNNVFHWHRNWVMPSYYLEGYTRAGGFNVAFQDSFWDTEATEEEIADPSYPSPWGDPEKYQEV